ncbi:MAG: PAAR-like domain-containing protein [Paracoccaceae bacterium]
MTDTIAANGQTLCHKKSTGFVRSTLPDVCKAPTYPAPFTNIAFAKQLAKGTKTVKSHKGAMCAIKGSEFSTSIGDEPGVGGGVKSGVNMNKATWLSWSPNVFAEGKPVARLSDRMLMNKGNTVSAAGYFTGPITGASKQTLDFLCVIACAALESGTNQAGVEAALRTQLATQPQPVQSGLFPEITFDRAGQMYRNADGTPQTRYGVPGSRLDVTTVVAGQPVEFIEMKFPGDRMRGTQARRYENIARQRGKRLQVMEIPADCNDCEGQQPEDSQGESSNFWSWVLGGAALLGIGACLYFSAGICAIPLGLGGATVAATS